MEENMCMEENKEAEDVVEVQIQEFLEGEIDFWLEDLRSDVGAIIEGALYDVMKDNGGIEKLLYIKKVNGHLEIGAVKKIEIIY